MPFQNEILKIIWIKKKSVSNLFAKSKNEFLEKRNNDNQNMSANSFTKDNVEDE